MSSAGQLIRSKFDYYRTNPKDVETFLNSFITRNNYSFRDKLILDPCAGGDHKYDMPYPLTLKKFGVKEENILTIDIREDSKANQKLDYLSLSASFSNEIDLIISNPPFELAQEFILQSFRILNNSIKKESKFIIFLLRLPFLESLDRFEFNKRFTPNQIYVYHNRLSFFPENTEVEAKNGTKKVIKAGSTDSCAYAHFVWDVNNKVSESRLFLI